MTIVRSDAGGTYTPPGHDASVRSRKLFNPSNGCPKLDAHVTTFAPGAGMEEEIHEGSDHVFFMVQGELEVFRGAEAAGTIGPGYAVHIPAGEPHRLRNAGPSDAVFLAVTTLP